jgi:phage baseplate assembly protein W
VSVDFPYSIDGRGRTAASSGDQHVRDLIEQVLFTAPGERVMRPDFGSGLLRLVFEPAGAELVATTQALVIGALQQFLGDVIAVEGVDIAQDDGTLTVAVSYVVTRTQQTATATFTRSTA